MMKFTFKNPLEVNENDMFGTAVLKKLTNGYVKGTLAAGIGLGVLAIGSKLISNKIESERDEELEEKLIYSGKYKAIFTNQDGDKIEMVLEDHEVRNKHSEMVDKGYYWVEIFSI